MKSLEEFAHKQGKIRTSETGAFSRSHYRSSKINLFHFLNTSIIGDGATRSDLSMNYFGMGSVRPSASALVQTKNKTPVSVFSALHKATLALYSMDKKYKEHRAIAFDGTNEPVAPNEDEPDYIIYTKNRSKSVFLNHLNQIAKKRSRQLMNTKSIQLRRYGPSGTRSPRSGRRIEQSVKLQKRRFKL